MTMGYCCNRQEPQKRSASLRFKREEILYDIKNCAFVEGEVMGEDFQHAQHTLVEIGEKGNVDRVTRVINMAFAVAREMLYPFTRRMPCDEEIDDSLLEPDEYVLEMEVPVTFSRTTLDLLSKLIHEFIVYRVMYDWLSITNRQAAGHWLDKAAEAEDRIKKVKNKGRAVFTRSCSPQW